MYNYKLQGEFEAQTHSTVKKKKENDLVWGSGQLPDEAVFELRSKRAKGITRWRMNERRVRQLVQMCKGQPYGSLPNSMFRLVGWNQPGWQYLHHGNLQALQAGLSFGKPGCETGASTHLGEREGVLGKVNKVEKYCSNIDDLRPSLLIALPETLCLGTLSNSLSCSVF